MVPGNASAYAIRYSYSIYVLSLRFRTYNTAYHHMFEDESKLTPWIFKTSLVFKMSECVFNFIENSYLVYFTSQ